MLKFVQKLDPAPPTCVYSRVAPLNTTMNKINVTKQGHNKRNVIKLCKRTYIHMNMLNMLVLY